ncbi:GNAT family N-acetyltransferase [Pedococcus sp. NPDC057267]|uniref:GNAT family N-acetyltransferase n=1 Tax=Pedococcus sp. NPDC057267 TaxID=3346077 RepID=UPI0036408934
MTTDPTRITSGTASQASAVFTAAGMRTACEDLSEGLADDELCLIAWLGEEVAGAAVGRPDSLAFDDAGREYLYAVLEWLAVLPVHRGLHIGTRLLEAFCELSCSRGARAVHLRMSPSRVTELQGFYEARGFSDAGDGSWSRSCR